MKTIQEFTSGDGAHCGLADWYPNKEAALKSALKGRQPFDTGWYGSKKEIASARVYSQDGKNVCVEVSVSDDFDTNGTGFSKCPAKIESIRKAIHRAWDDAAEVQKNNREYAGYSLHHWSTKIPDWHRDPGVYPRETRKRYRSKHPQCLDYYIVNVSGMDSPPGDNYHHWGWQESDDNGVTLDPSIGVPKEVLAKLEDFANRLKPGSLRIGDWEIREWEDA